MRFAVLLVLALLTWLPSDAAAQKNCVKGKPCGNTCISRDKTCRVGSGPAPSSASTPAATSAPDAPARARFVASSRGQVYYLLACSAAQRLSPANRIYFETEEEAVGVGYRPSTASGCGTGAAPHVASVSERAPPATATGSTPVPIGTRTCTLSAVYDGDTVTCRGGQKIRLLLIDTPEMTQGEFGRTARSALLDLAPLGSTVRLELDLDPQDRYGRTLAYLWLPDGRMVNEEMARGGYALPLTYPPNVRYVDRIRAAVEDAKAARRGLWGGSAFNCTPKEHRDGQCR